MRFAIAQSSSCWTNAPSLGSLQPTLTQNGRPAVSKTEDLLQVNHMKGVKKVPLKSFHQSVPGRSTPATQEKAAAPLVKAAAPLVITDVKEFPCLPSMPKVHQTFLLFALHSAA